jgi:hypothetical protein
MVGDAFPMQTPYGQDVGSLLDTTVDTTFCYDTRVLASNQSYVS